MTSKESRTVLRGMGFCDGSCLLDETKPLSFYTRYLTCVNQQAKPGTPPIYPKAQGGMITPLSLCLYAGGSSFDQTGIQSYEQMSLSNYTIGGQTFTNDTYLRYPNLKDLIPEDATLTSVQVVVTQDMAHSNIKQKVIDLLLMMNCCMEQCFTMELFLTNMVTRFRKNPTHML